MRIADAIFTRPEGMEGQEHVSVRTLIEDGAVFTINDFVLRERKVWVDGKDTGEQETVADMSIQVGEDQYHVFINTRNLMNKLTKMNDYRLQKMVLKR